MTTSQTASEGGEKLLPCPFCGSRDIGDDDCSDMQTNGIRIFCRDCGACVCGYGASTCQTRAIAAWNARHGEAGGDGDDEAAPDWEKHVSGAIFDKTFEESTEASQLAISLTVACLNDAINGKDTGAGTYGNADLEACRQRILALRASQAKALAIVWKCKHCHDTGRVTVMCSQKRGVETEACTFCDAGKAKALAGKDEVERVAKAIAARHERELFQHWPAMWENWPKETCDMYRTMAEAAIAALGRGKHADG